MTTTTRTDDTRPLAYAVRWKLTSHCLYCNFVVGLSGGHAIFPRTLVDKKFFALQTAKNILVALLLCNHHVVYKKENSRNINTAEKKKFSKSNQSLSSFQQRSANFPFLINLAPCFSRLTIFRLDSSSEVTILLSVLDTTKKRPSAFVFIATSSEIKSLRNAVEIKFCFIEGYKPRGKRSARG